MRGVPCRMELSWGKVNMAYKGTRRGMICIPLFLFLISSPFLVAYGNRMLTRISTPHVLTARIRENRLCVYEHSSCTANALLYIKNRQTSFFYNPWEISDVVTIGTIAYGRVMSTFLMPSSAYSLYVSSEKYGKRLRSELQKNRVDAVFLGDMFVALYKEKHECVIVPYLSGQFKIRYVSPQIMAFPDGAIYARETWNNASKELLFPGSPFTSLSLMWP
jgi:hypothetical protein